MASKINLLWKNIWIRSWKAPPQRRKLPSCPFSYEYEKKNLSSLHLFSEGQIVLWIEPIPTWIYLIWMNIIAKVNKAKFCYHKNFKTNNHHKENSHKPWLLAHAWLSFLKYAIQNYSTWFYQVLNIHYSNSF